MVDDLDGPRMASPVDSGPLDPAVTLFLCVRLNSGLSEVNDTRAHGRFNRTSSSGADHGKGSIFISETSSTRGPIPLGQK